jgi:hypothetical protein
MIFHEAEWTPLQIHCYSEKSGSFENRTRSLWICSHELWPLGLRGGLYYQTFTNNIEEAKGMVAGGLLCKLPVKRLLRVPDLGYLIADMLASISHLALVFYANSWLILVSISHLVLVFTVTITTYDASAISASPSKFCPPLGKSVLHYYFLVAQFFRYISLWSPEAPIYPHYDLKGITYGFCNGNVNLVAEEFRQRFLQRRISKRRLLIRVHQHERWSDSLQSASLKNERPIREHVSEGEQKKKTNSVALSPRANYTDWATAICRRNLVPTFADWGVSGGQRGGSTTVVNLSFIDRSRDFFFK